MGKEKETLSLKYQSKGKKTEGILNVDYMLIAVGREPQLDYIGSTLKKNMDRLKADGLFYAIGDVQNSRYRQTAICVGDGVKAAMMIHEKLRSTA